MGNAVTILPSSGGWCAIFKKKAWRMITGKVDVIQLGQFFVDNVGIRANITL